MKQTFLRGTALLLAAVAMPVIIAACDDDETTGPSQTPANIAAAVSPPAAGTAGLAVQGPSVVVTDAAGAPVAGAIVRFTVTAGGGAVQYPVVETDAAGVASAGTWQLGAPGANTVSASVEGVASLAFTTQSQLGPVALVRKLGGDNQVGQRGTSLPVPLTVQVVNAGGFPISGVQVTFAVTQGGGTIGDAVQVTDVNGLATSGTWTLGNVFGTHRVTATASGVVATFEAIVDPCFDREPIVVGQTVNGELEFGDEHCAIGGRAADRYRLTTGAEAVNISLNSAAFDAMLNVRNDAATRLIAADNNSGAGTNSFLKLIAAATSKTVEATSVAAGATGAYELSVAAAVEAESDCQATAFETFVEIGASTNQVFVNTPATCGAVPFHSFRVWVPAGAQVRFEVVGTAAPRIDFVLFLYGPEGGVDQMPFGTWPPQGNFLAWADDQFDSATPETITFTAASSAFYRVRAVSYGYGFSDPWNRELGPLRFSVVALGGVAATEGASFSLTEALISESQARSAARGQAPTPLSSGGKKVLPQ